MGKPLLDWDKMTNEEILQLFKEQYLKYNPKDATEYIEKCNMPSLYILKNRLNLSWNTALIKIGIQKNDIRFYRKTKDEYITIIKDLTEQLGKVPSAKEMLEYKNISVSNLKKTFNLTYNEFLKEMELEPNQKICNITESNEELLKMYKDFCNKLGRVATSKDLNESDEIYNSGVFFIRFGGFNNLRKLAGYKEWERSKKRYTKYSLLQGLKEEYIKKGSKLTQGELEITCENNEKLSSPTTLLSYFKTTSYDEIWNQVEKSLIKDYIKLLKKNEHK